MHIESIQLQVLLLRETLSSTSLHAVRSWNNSSLDDSMGLAK